MSLCQQSLQRIRQSVSKLMMPPLGLLPLMFDERKRQRDNEAREFERQQAMKEQQGQEAMTRVFTRHETLLRTHYNNYVDALDNKGGK